jgi:DNA-binding PadR family transcriptional regulator
MNFQVTKPGFEMGVLSLLRRNDMYGYEIIAAISGVARITAGSVYPMLKAMKQEGLVDVFGGRADGRAEEILQNHRSGRTPLSGIAG